MGGGRRGDTIRMQQSDDIQAPLEDTAGGSGGEEGCKHPRRYAFFNKQCSEEEPKKFCPFRVTDGRLEHSGPVTHHANTGRHKIM